MKESFLNQVGICDNYPRGTIDDISKKKPGGHTCREPDNKWDIFHRLNPESYAEDDPENKNHHHRLYEGPDKTEQRPYILSCYLSFRHGYNQMFLQKYQSDEVKKTLYHFTAILF